MKNNTDVHASKLYYRNVYVYHWLMGKPSHRHYKKFQDYYIVDGNFGNFNGD